MTNEEKEKLKDLLYQSKFIADKNAKDPICYNILNRSH